MYINYLSFIVLIILSSFFSGSETAFMAVNRIKIKDMINKGDHRARKVEKLLEDETKLLTTILIGNNLVNIAASAIATSIAIDIFGSKGVGIATGVVTLLILIFGEITPKSIGNHRSIKYSKFAAPYLLFLRKVLTPVILIFSWLIKKMVRDENLITSAFLSEEEIRRFVNVSEREGVIKEVEGEMIKSVFEFDDILVKEIMVPRINMVCVNINTDINELVKLAIEKGHSRIPVYENSIDDIVGLIYVKDLLKLIINSYQDKKLKDFIKPIYFIPESKAINKLLNDMKQRKEHMAIVLDEYGGTSGLITIEDLLEEIVGDIQDEFDLEPKKIEIVNDNELLLDAGVDIEELVELLPDLNIDKNEYETISGFILYNLGYLPVEEEEISLKGLKIKIEEVSEHRIDRVRVISEKPIKMD